MRSALEKFAAVQMVDVRIPTTDGRELQLTRYTQSETELELLMERDLALENDSRVPSRTYSNWPAQVADYARPDT